MENSICLPRSLAHRLVSAFLPGTGTGELGAAQHFDSLTYASSITLSDFNGDSKTDILAANPADGMVSVLLGTGTGVFRTPLSVASGANPIAVAVGDFNGDGCTDAVSANAGSNSVSVLLNDGNWMRSMLRH